MTLQEHVQGMFNIVVTFLYDTWVYIAIGVAALIVLINIKNILGAIKRKDSDSLSYNIKNLVRQLIVLLLAVAVVVIFLYIIGK